VRNLVAAAAACGVRNLRVFGSITPLIESLPDEDPATGPIQPELNCPLMMMRTVVDRLP